MTLLGYWPFDNKPSTMEFNPLEFNPGEFNTGGLSSVAVSSREFNPLEFNPAEFHTAGFSSIGYALDESGNAKTLRLTRLATYVPGKVDKALTFDGNRQYLQPELAIDLDINTGGFSISAWIKLSNVGFLATVVRKRDSSSTSPGYSLTVSSAKKLTAELCDGSASVITITGVTNFTALTWYFIVATFDRSGNCSIYLNNNLEKATSISAQPASIGNTNKFTVGRHSSLAQDYFLGFIDELRFFDHVLSSDERSALNSHGSNQLIGTTRSALLRHKTRAAIIG